MRYACQPHRGSEPTSSGKGASDFPGELSGRLGKMMAEEDDHTLASTEAEPQTQSTPKIPPGFDGRASWLSYEEAIDDWVETCALDA